ILFRLRTGVDYREREKVARLTWLIVLEELNYWGLSGDAQTRDDEERIANLLTWVENSLYEDRLKRDAGSWITTERVRLPVSISSSTEAMRLLRSMPKPLTQKRFLWIRRVVDGIELSTNSLRQSNKIAMVAPAGPIRVSVLPHTKSSVEGRQD